MSARKYKNYIVGALVLLLATSLHSSWLTGWNYRKLITISGSSGAGAGYQVLLKVGESSGASGAHFHIEGHSAMFPSGANNGGDLRFTASNGTTLLDFWVEKVVGTSPNRVAYVWVEVAANLNTNQDIYCYYGNSSATNASNGDNTFLFFDDFDVATMTVSGGTAYRNFPSLGNISFEIVYWVQHLGGHTGYYEYGYVQYGIKDTVTGDWWLFNSYIGDNSLFNVHQIYGTSSWVQTAGSGFRLSNNVFYKKRLRHLANTNFQAQILDSNDNLVIERTYTDSRSFSPNQIHWKVRTDGSYYITYDAINKLYKLKGNSDNIWVTEEWVYFLFIKKYVSPEPSFSSAGSEQFPILPPVVTNASGASDITTTSARLNGTLVDNGNENPTVHIFWGTSDGGTNQSAWENDINLGTLPEGPFYYDITGLSPNTTYYYRCYAQNSAGSDWADETASFITWASIVVDWNNGNVQTITLQGNAYFTFTNGKPGGIYKLLVKGDDISQRTIKFDPAIVIWVWPYNTPPDFTIAPNRLKIFDFICYPQGSSIYYLGVMTWEYELPH